MPSRKVAQKKGITAGQMALAYVLQMSPMVGAKI